MAEDNLVRRHYLLVVLARDTSVDFKDIDRNERESRSESDLHESFDGAAVAWSGNPYPTPALILPQLGSTAQRHLLAKNKYHGPLGENCIQQALSGDAVNHIAQSDFGERLREEDRPALGRDRHGRSASSRPRVQGYSVT
jgi:hypothetical protein